MSKNLLRSGLDGEEDEDHGSWGGTGGGERKREAEMIKNKLHSIHRSVQAKCAKQSHISIDRNKPSSN